MVWCVVCVVWCVWCVVWCVVCGVWCEVSRAGGVGGTDSAAELGQLSRDLNFTYMYVCTYSY